MVEKSEAPAGAKVERFPEIIGEIERQLRLAIPPAFELNLEMPAALGSGVRDIEQQLKIKFANQQTLSFSVEVKKSLDSSGLFKSLQKAQLEIAQGLKPLLLARYISEPAQAELKKLAISFADATGNIFISAPESGLLISNTGLQRDPWRKAGRPAATLTGVSTQLVIRALIDLPEPYPMSVLIRESGAARGSAYAAIDMLAAAGFIEREGKGQIMKVNWFALAEAWAAETDFFKANTTYSFIAPRGLDRLIEDLRVVDPALYVCTGTIGAAAYKSSAGLFTAMIYSTNVSDLATKLGLRETGRGANVILARADSDGPFQRTTEFEGLRIAAPSQIYRDLMSGPGRNPEEAKNLLNWMVSNVELWRKSS